MDALQPGTQLGGYQLESQIGRGAMSFVYRARRPGSSRHVAIKVLLANLAAQEGFVDRFKREARAVSMLAHRNIVALYEYGEHDGHVYLVMEYIPGQSLGRLMRGRIPVARSIGYMMQLADALQYAHNLGVVHRDVKPGNLMVEEKTDRLVLMDFGLSKIAEESLQLTRPGTNLGTPHYMSPEQVLGRPVDGRTDVYAAGIVLYQLVTGKLPFDVESGNAVAVLKRVLQEPMPSPRSEVPSLPESLERVILTATAKKREDRYPDAQALKGALASCAADVSHALSRPLGPAVAVPSMEGTIAPGRGAETSPLLAGAAASAPGAPLASPGPGLRTFASAGIPAAPMQEPLPSAAARPWAQTPQRAEQGAPSPSRPRSLLSVRPSPLSQPPAAVPDHLLPPAPVSQPPTSTPRRTVPVSPNLVALLVVAAVVAVVFVAVVFGHQP